MTCPRIPLRLYFAPFILWPWWAVCRARRWRAAVVAVLVAVAMIAGVGVVATRAPVPGCKWRVVAGPGREHLVCAEAAP